MKKTTKLMLALSLMGAAFVSNAKILNLYNFESAEYDKVNTASTLSATAAKQYLPPIEEIHAYYDKLVEKGVKPKVAMGRSLKVLNNAIQDVRAQAAKDKKTEKLGKKLEDKFGDKKSPTKTP